MENQKINRSRQGSGKAGPKPDGDRWKNLNPDLSDSGYSGTPDVLSDIVFGVTHDGTIHQVYGGAPEVLQRSADGLARQRLEDAFGEDLAGVIRKAMHACDAGGRSDATPHPVVIDGQNRWLTVSVSDVSACGTDLRFS